MKILVSLLLIGLSHFIVAQDKPSQDIVLGKKWQSLLDKDLSHWELFVGIPHTSVNLPFDHPKSDNVRAGVPLGLNNDPTGVMTTMIENDEVILKITGEIYAGLTTLQEYGNYHLKVKFKWGDKKWEPRLDRKRDNGILYHCQGEHGAFWKVWMASLECQIQEEDMGDFVALLNVRADINSKKVDDKLYQLTGQNDEPITYGLGKGLPKYCHIPGANEKDKGEWNTIEVICVGDQSMHIVNGKVLMVVNNARSVVDGQEQPLVNGKIQLQSEAAESYYKDIMIKKAVKFPKAYRKQAEALVGNEK